MLIVGEWHVSLFDQLGRLSFSTLMQCWHTRDAATPQRGAAPRAQLADAIVEVERDRALAEHRASA